MSGFFENVANLIAPIRDVLLLILGALVTLLSTLLVQHRRAKDDLRVKVLSGTVERLTQVEDLVALIFTELGRESIKPLMMAATAPLGFPSRQTRELEAAATKLKLLAHSFRRYPLLTDSVLYLVRATEEILSTTTMTSLGLPSLAPTKEDEVEERARKLDKLQTKVSVYTFTTHLLIDRIIAADLRTDQTLPMRFGRQVRQPFHFLRRQWNSLKEHRRSQEA